MILTPEGKLSRYFYGVEYSPRDVRLGLVEASQNKIGTPVDQILLFCYHYDPATGKYGAIAMNMLRISGRHTSCWWAAHSCDRVAPRLARAPS
jgi:protein SCO1